MFASRREGIRSQLVRGRTLCPALFLLLSVTAADAVGQEQINGTVQAMTPSQEHAHSEAVTPLQDLLIEAEQNNPQVEAARHGWEAAKQIPSQVSTLPDPQINVQQVNVGSPRPFAGYTNSDFSYIGFGISQDILSLAKTLLGFVIKSLQRTVPLRLCV